MSDSFQWAEMQIASSGCQLLFADAPCSILIAIAIAHAAANILFIAHKKYDKVSKMLSCLL